MNAFDREFRNGALKALIVAERDLKKLLDEARCRWKGGDKGCNYKGKGIEGEHWDATWEFSDEGSEGDRVGRSGL